jgi:D-aminoacyl-tRNA deacylase
MVFLLKVLCFLFFISLPKPNASMRLVVQRVKSASVTVQGKVVSQIDAGLVALVGLHENDTLQDAELCCKRLLACKLFANDTGGMWRHSVKQRNLELLLVSQFTLYGKLSKKNQPDYKYAMKNIPAEALYMQFLAMVREQYGEADKVKDGVFGEMMDVALVNDGPVTILIESEPAIAGISIKHNRANNVGNTGT